LRETGDAVEFAERIAAVCAGVLGDALASIILTRIAIRHAARR
jgi:hypothetical protein